jgi:fido (protein-threonine AMPylation protein)
MKPVFPKPSKSELFHFIVETNEIERTTTTYNDVERTFNSKNPKLLKKMSQELRGPVFIHPHSAGHFAAFDFIFKQLSGNQNWPAQHKIQFSNKQKSETNTTWVKELHKKVFKPVAEYGIAMADPEAMPMRELGQYRLRPHFVGLRKMPKATAVPELLHHWYAELGQFHLNVKNKVARPSNDTVLACINKAKEAHFMFACIHPFSDGTGRVARLIENALRLRWGLPWKTYYKKDAVRYVKEIAAYEDSDQWQSVLQEYDASDKPKNR